MKASRCFQRYNIYCMMIETLLKLQSLLLAGPLLAMYGTPWFPWQMKVPFLKAYEK